MDETWFSRDLPVLRAIIELDDESDGSFITEEQVADRTGLDATSVRRAMRALSREHPPFATIESSSMAGDYDAHGATGHGRRTVGLWPTPKTEAAEQVAAIVEALKQAEDDAPDEASKSKIRKVAEAFTSLPAQLAGAVGTAAALKLAGLS